MTENQDDVKKDEKKKMVLGIIIYIVIFSAVMGLQGFNAYQSATQPEPDPINPYIIGEDDDFTYWEVIVQPSKHDDAVAYINDHDGQIISETGRIRDWWIDITYKIPK